MGKGTAIFLTILFVILAGGAVIGIDVYMSYKSFTDNPDSFDVTDINSVIAVDNETAVVSALIVTPKLGYMPKSVKLDIEVFKNGNTTVYLAQTITIPLGENKTVEFTITFETADIATITSGGSLQFDVVVVATPIYIGIPLNFLQVEIPPISVEIPE